MEHRKRSDILQNVLQRALDKRYIGHGFLGFFIRDGYV